MRTILIADDSTTVHRVVEHAFAGSRIRVVAAADGRAAVDLARRERPDIALCDVLMPGLSGYEVAEAFARDAALADIPVLLLTGTFEPFDETRAARCGAVGHLAKPFESSVLRHKVDEILHARPATAAAPAPDLADDAPIQAPAPRDPPAERPHAGPLDLPAAGGAALRAARAAEWSSLAVPLPGEEGFDLSRPPSGEFAPPRPPAAAVSAAAAEEIHREECRRQIAALAPDIIREVAWEVVPDLLERLLREVVPPRPAAPPDAGAPSGERRR